ncbi:acyl-CoA synthetase [Ornithinimicrobium tianjinense]|uniref:acetate--CoA ligase n=1 Tax=Ornithinimicrobium tianjinense TaxID=1195761 RepID=A0A917BVW1_9MICO|nr:AMP-binding protein [Ornithinimicrobium tianjinense]GGF58424.1 acetyl-coenzyme A synthetase [Ornithinimicrobium tianjinense]
MADARPPRIVGEPVTPLPPSEAWADVAARMHLLEPPTALWGDDGRWLTGARLNLSVTCLDRHLEERGDAVAVHWEGEPGDRRDLTYRELHEQVVGLARALRGMGVGPGDRVGLHLGWLPETVVAMLACARIGAVHSVLPSSLPAGPLADRLALLDLKVLFTQDGAWRHGTVLPLKARVDDALAAVGSVQHTIVVRRTGMDVAWYEGDRWYHDVVATVPRPRRGESGRARHTSEDEPVALDAEHPVASVPIAARAGQQVSVVHGTAAVLASAIAVHGHLRTGGPFWCAGDIAWAVTQFHGVYGPLAWGDASVMYEGTLDVPHHGRAWEIVRRYGVETLVTSPSVMRTIRGWARDMRALGSAPTLRRIATAGEPVEAELATWLVEAFGGGDLEVLDAWGQLELGGIVRVTGPGERPPMPGCGIDLVDPAGRLVPDGEPGEVVLRRPWAGVLVGVEGSTDRDHWGHWERHPGVYSTGDLAVRDADGSISFLGRADDVVSVSGQLVSLGEVREVLTDHPFVAAARVTVRKDVALGRAIVAAVVLSDGAGSDPDLDAVAVELMAAVREDLGGLARPRAVLVVDRFGEELGREALSRAIAALATPDRAGTPRSVTWEQLVAAAGEA